MTDDLKKNFDNSAELKAARDTRFDNDVATLNANWERNDRLAKFVTDINGLKGDGYKLSVSRSVIRNEKDDVYQAPSLGASVELQVKKGILSTTKKYALEIILGLDGAYAVRDGLETSFGALGNKSSLGSNATLSTLQNWITQVAQTNDLPVFDDLLRNQNAQAAEAARSKQKAPTPKAA